MPTLGPLFLQNIAALKNWADPYVVSGMEIAQAKVLEHMKANHPKAPTLKQSGEWARTIKYHLIPDRFNTVTGKLVNSMRPGPVTTHRSGITAEINAGSGSVVDYAIPVEFGTARSRAYPFFQDALEYKQDEVLMILGRAVVMALNRDS